MKILKKKKSNDKDIKTYRRNILSLVPFEAIHSKCNSWIVILHKLKQKKKKNFLISVHISTINCSIRQAFKSKKNPTKKFVITLYERTKLQIFTLEWSTSSKSLDFSPAV